MLTSLLTLLFVAPPLEAGFASADITPPLGYGMAGYYSERGATGTLDPLLAKVVYLRQDDVAAAVVVCDLVGIDERITMAVREELASREALKLTGESVVVAATHSHTAPDYVDDIGKSDATYPPKLIEAIVEAVVAAADAKRPVELSVGVGHAEGVAFNRRHVMPDGSVKTWARYTRDNPVRPAGPAPTDVRCVFLKPAEGPRVALATFALHLDTVGGTEWSADYPAVADRLLKERFGQDFGFVFGAAPCGDINHVNPQDGTRTATGLIGERLANAVEDAREESVSETPALRVVARTVELPLQEIAEGEMDWAKKVIAADKAGNPGPMLDRVKAYKLRKLKRLRDESQSTDPPTIGLDVRVLRLGEETAVVFLPGEIFADLGLSIQRYSPFRNTLVVELANQKRMSYVPTQLAFDGGGYEPTNSVIQPGGGEDLAREAVEMLKELRR